MLCFNSRFPVPSSHGLRFRSRFVGYRGRDTHLMCPSIICPWYHIIFYHIYNAACFCFLEFPSDYLSSFLFPSPPHLSFVISQKLQISLRSFSISHLLQETPHSDAQHARETSSPERARRRCGGGGGGGSSGG